MADAMDVADYIIVKSKQMNIPVSNLKLQKILYFLNAISLVEKAQLLLDHAKFEKWDYGATLRNVYDEYDSNMGNPILKPKKHVVLTYDNNLFNTQIKEFSIDNLNKEDRNFINAKLPCFLQFDTFHLINMSLDEPQWQDKSSYYYSNDLTRNYYLQKCHQFWIN